MLLESGYQQHSIRHLAFDFMIFFANMILEEKKKFSHKKEATDMYLDFFIKYQLNPILDQRNIERQKQEILQKENEELKKRNSELETNLRELEVVKAENQTLQEYMNLTEKYSDYNAIPAYVINRDVSNYSSNLVINVGKKDGIEENMTVIADKGLVGHIISVTENTAKVQVIVDPACTVSCMISTTEESIICKGTLDNNQIIRASYIPTSAELIIGDSIQTSGIGGIYHRGIFIGTIKDIVTTNNATDRYAVVEPAVDFSKVNSVLVIKD